jgi:hypothetical protein
MFASEAVLREARDGANVKESSINRLRMTHGAAFSSAAIPAFISG